MSRLLGQILVQSLSIEVALEYLGKANFAVSLENVGYRRELYRIGDGSDQAARIGRFFDPSPSELANLCLSMADWLPRTGHRLLWVEHYDVGFPSPINHFLNILGENLAADHLVENPAIRIGPLPTDLMDQLAGTPAENSEAEALITLCTLLSIGQWNAKLLTSDSTDFIEFWEGNVLFYSESGEALRRAHQILDFFGLGTDMS